VYGPAPPKEKKKRRREKWTAKARRNLTTSAFEGSVDLLLRRDPESFSAAGSKTEAR
jgi:hypothetical protein